MRKPTMSYNENSSSPPSDRPDGRQESVQQSRGDPRYLNNGVVSPSSRMRTGGQSQSLNNGIGATQGTMPSPPYRSSLQPINDAVTSAVNTTDSNLSPELIQLITQNVTQSVTQSVTQNIMQQLLASGAQIPPTVQPVQPPTRYAADQPDTISMLPGSPPIDRATVYTPPSPHRVGENQPEDPSISMVSTAAREATLKYESARPGNLSPLSHGSTEEAIISDAESRASRPDALRRSSTDPDATVLERHWGKLFDEQGQSTLRLEHFLKGIALHLIECYEPKHSLVITPDKMQRYYEDTKLETQSEIYPWKLVFDDKTSSISRLLRDADVKVQHHLVQSAPDARPDVPGLTPTGFASWMTLLIRAHPDHEYQRLAKTLRLMAINHPEERTQRFPAAISRRLFPAVGDEALASRLTELMAAHCKVQVSSRHNSTTNAPVERPSRKDPPQSPRKNEAPPAPTVEDAVDESMKAEPMSAKGPKDSGVSFSATSNRDSIPQFAPEMSKAYSATSIEDDSDSPTPKPPIERQRQPYVAQPGGGKNHDVVSSGDEQVEGTQPLDNNDLRRTKSVSNSTRPRAPPPIAIHQSGAAQPLPQDGGELSRSRSTVTSGPDGGSLHRTRSNSSYTSESRPFRRSRSNSTYTNEAGPRYHPQRSPSFSKAGFDSQSPRVAMPDMNYQNYNNTNANAYPPPADKYEYARSSMYDSRYGDREKSRDRNHDPRSSRPRLQSATGPDNHAYPDDYYRQQQGYNSSNGVVQPTGGAYQYPPVSYRDGGR